MTITRFLALLSVLALLAAMPLAAVFAQDSTPMPTEEPEAMEEPEATEEPEGRPVQPQKFYGMVMVDGAAAAGVTVTAMIGDDEVASAMTDDEGSYNFTIMGSSSYSPQTAITFMVGDATGMAAMDDGMMMSEVMWSSGSITELNLSAGDIPPTPTPASPCVPG